jgi:hypothetical protein
MKKCLALMFLALSLLFVGELEALGSMVGIRPDRIQLIKEIQGRLNRSFQCDFSVSIGETRKYATGNSGGIIIIDKSFLESADRERIFFAIAHEYAHAYLEHDILVYEHLSHRSEDSDSKSLVEVRRRCEKEADGIAARKAKQMGFSIESILEFILAQSDPEKGVPPEYRVYSKPRERAEYILAVYQSS